MDMLKRLNAAIRYVEENLCGEIDMAKLSQIACIDENSFARLFGYIAGMTLHEYIRRRRLTLAGYELRHGGKVIDMAIKYGYSSADAFAKAFKKQHGITPTLARDCSLTLKVYPPASFHITVKGAKAMNFKIVEMQQKKVYGLSRPFGGTPGERFELEHVMWAEEEEAVPSKICGGYDGIWYGIWREGRYAIARAADDASGENLEEYLIPAENYAVFVTERGGFAGDELPKLRELIFESWLPDSGYEQAGDLEVEIYHLCTDRELRRKNRYYEIWIPVRKNKTSVSITTEGNVHGTV